MEIIPALLHGDLWGGNVAEDDSGPVIFDPASFYGHSEYELAIAGMFGGFSGSFYSAYHSKIPKAPGFEKRLKLYQLFHYMNHWNHFGGGYRGSSINIMRNLVKWLAIWVFYSLSKHTWCTCMCTFSCAVAYMLHYLLTLHPYSIAKDKTLLPVPGLVFLYCSLSNNVFIEEFLLLGWYCKFFIEWARENTSYGSSWE